MLDAVASLQGLLCNDKETEAKMRKFAAESGVGMLSKGGARQGDSSGCMPGAFPTLRAGYRLQIYSMAKFSSLTSKSEDIQPHTFDVHLHIQSAA